MPINRPRFVAALMAALFLFPLLCPGFGIQLRISSGLHRMNLNEVNFALAGWAEGWKRLAEFDPNQSFESAKVGTLRHGFDFEGELLLTFSRWLGLGISGGYVYESLGEENAFVSIHQEGALKDYARPTKASGLTMLVSGYFFIPFGQKLSAYLRGGLGAVQANYVAHEAQKAAEDERFLYLISDTADARRLTYLGGIGLSYAFDPNLGFFLEAVAQPMKVSGFSGENREGQKGTLYYFEEYRQELGLWEARMHVFPEQPGGANIRNVREATVDFSGYSVKIGIQLKF